MITSSSNPRVKQVVQWQTSARERHRAGVFVTEGFKLFQEAPAECLQEVYISREVLDREPGSSKLWEKLEQTGYETVSEEVFRRMSDTQTPQGILCVARQPVYRLKQLLQASHPLLTVLEDLQDPGNLGTIFRTGEGAGVTGII
ncbi:MAG: 23S rRNA (guanosine(2251)-2'-O)-methyltransferase RlmB, partial [Acetatifactor sp.]|nr:23S rRNA (guanosine(2251)-2'-O)-methyltransferase RlmB [Acetatifactor sp.]